MSRATQRGPGYWEGLAVAVAKDRALLTPPAAALLVWALDVAERSAARDGVRLSNAPHLKHLRQVLELVASGHEDVRTEASVPLSRAMESISTAEAARMLGLTCRHVRRLAREGAFGAVLKSNGAGYRLDPTAIRAYKLVMQETR